MTKTPIATTQAGGRVEQERASGNGDANDENTKKHAMPPAAAGVPKTTSTTTTTTAATTTTRKTSADTDFCYSMEEFALDKYHLRMSCTCSTSRAEMTEDKWFASTVDCATTSSSSNQGRSGQVILNFTGKQLVSTTFCDDKVCLPSGGGIFGLRPWCGRICLTDVLIDNDDHNRGAGTCKISMNDETCTSCVIKREGICRGNSAKRLGVVRGAELNCGNVHPAWANGTWCGNEITLRETDEDSSSSSSLSSFAGGPLAYIVAGIGVLLVVILVVRRRTSATSQRANTLVAYHTIPRSTNDEVELPGVVVHEEDMPTTTPTI